MRRFKEGKERSGRAIGEERERGFGGRETENLITICDFIYKSKCAKIV